MEKIFHRFVSDDAGHVAADWTVLLAGAVMLVSAIFGTLATSGPELADAAQDRAAEHVVL
ncbi:hypothetical protein [Marimonas lutisalis]|uniref:hypothetical protein n=1 Tax=Marimonas lutisalis TaxID=2545756 RepID=UPI0010F61A10|nr:hypothetical protein [Marimonas lutisalis]